MYPIHLLTGNMSLTCLLTATLPLTIRSRDPIPSPCHPRRSSTATHSPRAKQQHSPGCEVEPDHPKEPPLQWQREEDPLADHLGDIHWEAFHKDSDLVQHVRQTYFRAHPPVFHKEVTYELTYSSERWQKWQASWTLKSTWFRTSGRAKRTSVLQITWLGGLPRTYTTSRYYHPLSLLRSWVSRGYTPLSLSSIKPVSCSAPGAGRRGRMRAPW